MSAEIESPRPLTVAEMAERLRQPFPPKAIRQREGARGKMLSYLETHTVIHRLNSATGNNWSFQVIRLEWHEDLLMALGELTIPGMGTRTGIGVQKVNERGGEDLVKGASSDSLKKAATLFGVGLELYGPDYEGDEPAASPEIGHRPIQQQQRPPVTLPAVQRAERGPLLPNGSPREQVATPPVVEDVPCPKCFAPVGKSHLRKCPTLAQPSEPAGNAYGRGA